MTNKELLELAAKAAGIDGCYASLDEFPDWMSVHDGEGIYYTSSLAWNPLANDAEAFRLAVKLRLSISTPHNDIGGETRPLVRSQDLEHGVCCNEGDEVIEDPYAATRRAIVRAAAKIGKRMETEK